MGPQEQIAFSFDQETMRKIAKGAMHALIVSALLGVLDYLANMVGMIKTDNAIAIMALAWFSQTGYQTIRQWIAGIPAFNS